MKKHRIKLRASRVRIDRGGCDSHGRYWGNGAPLYLVEDEHFVASVHVRAPDAKTAKLRALPDVEREIERHKGILGDITMKKRAKKSKKSRKTGKSLAGRVTRLESIVKKSGLGE